MVAKTKIKTEAEKSKVVKLTSVGNKVKPKVAPAVTMGKKAKQPIYIGGVSQKSILYFTKNLSILLRTGSILSESLQVLNSQLKDRLHVILTEVILDVEKGIMFSDALAKHPKVFPDLYVNIVRIGEESGMLEKNLEYLAEQLDKNYQLKKKVIGAMIYPMIILGGTFVLGICLAVFILPKIAEMFRSFKVKLPWTTRLLIGISDFIQNQGLLALVLFVVMVLAVMYLRRLKFIKPYSHRLILMLPVLGNVSKHFNLSMFYRSLSVLLKSGVTIDEGLRVCTKTTSNVTYQNFIMKTYDRIKSGETLYGELQSNGRLVPATDTQIINVGEASGTLSDSLAYIATIHEDELNDITRNLSSILEPILFIFLGVVVAILAMSIITPIYSITDQFH
jgi:type II secretory pathway component PulF